MLDKKSLSERDICTKFITPAIVKAGWDANTQFLEEVSFTDGKIYIRGKLHSRGQAKRADYILYYKPNIPIAIVEAKDNARQVLEALLDKYADEGIENIESFKVLNVIPFTDFGSRIEIVDEIFGGKKKYLEAVTGLETELYKIA